MNKNFGIWIYGTEQKPGELLGQIIDYNSAVAEERKIRYLYPYCLSTDLVGLSTGQRTVQQAVKVRPELEYYARQIPAYTRQIPADWQFYPLIDGSFYDKEKDRSVVLTPQQAEQLAEEIRVQLQPYQLRLQGIHLDLEALDRQQPGKQIKVFRALQERLAEEFSVPLSIATGRTDLTDLFRMVDHAVLMCYDLASPKETTPLPPRVYADRARGRINAFVKSVERAGSYSIGLPLAATSKEYEFEQGKEKEATWKMEDYAQAVYEAVEERFSDPKFLGVTIWNLRREKELHRKRMPDGSVRPVGPGSIRKEGWEWLASVVKK